MPKFQAHMEMQTITGVVSEPTATAYHPSSATHITQSEGLLPSTVLVHAPG